MTSITSHPESSASGADRDTLCALFDCELQGDEARFACRRLGHDAEWRATVGRWQLAGDVMRREAVGMAPQHFAARVAEALAAEPEAVALPIAVGGDMPVARPRARRRWIPGAALAASVAVAALFVARPLSNPDAPAGVDASPQVAGRDAMPVPAPSPGVGAPAAVAPAASTPATSRTVAAVEAPMPVSTPRPARPPTAAMADAQATTGSQALASTGSEPVANPFDPRATSPAVPTPARPWPRAVLPGYGAREGYSVGYDTGTTPSPSFYPFEPQFQPPPDQEAPSAPFVPEATPGPGGPRLH